MRAKFVFESLRFERGMEPKEAMDIGMNYLYPWEREKLGGLADRDFMKYDDAIKILKDPELVWDIVTDLKRQPKWTVEYQVHALNYLITHEGQAEMYKDLMPTRPIYNTPMRRVFKELEKNGVIQMERVGRRNMVYLKKGKFKI